MRSAPSIDSTPSPDVCFAGASTTGFTTPWDPNQFNDEQLETSIEPQANRQTASLRIACQLILYRIADDALPDVLERLRSAYADWAEQRGEDMQLPSPQDLDRRPQHESFVDRAQRLDDLGKVDTALDLVYDSIDEMLRNGRFAEIDSLLALVPTNRLSADMLLGLLTATLPARSRLPARQKFFRDVEAVLRDRGEHEDGLLVGLE